MNRDQQIEKAARAVHQSSLDDGAEHAEWDALMPSVKATYRADARVAAAVFLPQVSTVEELEALPEGTKLIGADGTAWEATPFNSDDYTWFGTSGDCWTTADLLTNFGPSLTVVWLP
jgi:hypothetical protein